MLKIKRAAMFGLDARIALAIFGALSVISGAALYSAIQTAKAEALHQYFLNIVKASEAYLLDNGKFLSQKNTTTVNVGDLVINRESLTTWKGPYISSTATLTDTLKDSITRQISVDAIGHMALQKKDIWAVNNTWQNCAAIGDENCAEYIGIGYYNASTGDAGFVKLKQMFSKLDKLIDNNDGERSGKIRYLYANPNNHYLYYQGLLRKREI